MGNISHLRKKIAKAQLKNRPSTNRATPPEPVLSRLVSCAVRNRHTTKIKSGYYSHYELRRSMDLPSPSSSHPDWEDGFLDSEGRFLNRTQARYVGFEAGQCYNSEKGLISAEVNW